MSEELYNVLMFKDVNGKVKSILIENEEYVILNNKILLNYIPDKNNKVIINGMYEVKQNQRITDNTQFKVDYSNGEITFHADKDNSTIIVTKYYGIGVIRIYADRVIDSTGDSVDTSRSLQDYIDSVKPYGYKGDYNPATTYEPSSIVAYDYGIYRCKQIAKGFLPTNTDYWEVMFTVKSEAEYAKAQGDYAKASADSIILISEDFTPETITVDNDIAPLVQNELDRIDSQITDIKTGSGTYGTKANRPTANLYPGREYFLTDVMKRIEYNGTRWQFLDGGIVDAIKIVDGNLYPSSTYVQQTVASGGTVTGGYNNGVDMTKDFILYTKIKLADNNDFFHIGFRINTTYQFQLTFGLDWTNANVKDGSSISIYDYINATKAKLGSLDMYTTSHEVVVWYDHKWGYLNVYVDNALIGSWKPTTGGANIAGVGNVIVEIGSGTTSVTFDYIYMATPLVTAIGDSITAGATTHAPNPDQYAGIDNYGSNYPKLLSDYLKSKGIKNYFVVNKGLNSDTTAGMVSRFTADIVNKGCKYVLIHGGINDYTGNNPTTTINNKKSMADTAIANNISPLVLGVIPTKTSSVSTSHQYSIDLHNAEKVSYLAYNYVDLWNSIQGSTDIADDTKMSDTVHPNLTGYTAMKDEIIKCITV